MDNKWKKVKAFIQGSNQSLFRMRYLLLSSLLLATLALASAEDFDYCKIKCKNTKHTSCTHKSDSPGKKCYEYGERLMTVPDKQKVLDKHNALRLQVARGEVAGQPAAKNMQTLMWSLELEQIARRWAFQCRFEHDECRSTKDGKSAGQNLAISNEKNINAQVQTQQWFDEYKIYKSTGDNAFHFDHLTGHYTALVWADTKYVGCETTEFTYKEAKRCLYLVCVYSPSGNVQGQPLYKTLPAGQQGSLLPAGGPRPGESGKPEETVLISGASALGHLECFAVLSASLVITLKSAMLTSV